MPADPAKPKLDAIDRKIIAVSKETGVELTTALASEMRSAAIKAAVDAVNNESLPRLFLKVKEKELESLRAKFALT